MYYVLYILAILCALVRFHGRVIVEFSTGKADDGLYVGTPVAVVFGVVSWNQLLVTGSSWSSSIMGGFGFFYCFWIIGAVLLTNVKFELCFADYLNRFKPSV